MKEHSVLAPASAARRVLCPGSRALEAQYPATESGSSLEGKQAHDLAGMILSSGGYTGNYSTEMYENVSIYTDEIQRINSSHTALHVEEAISIRTIHPLCWGTPDCWWLEKDELFLFDLKYGFKHVDVFENWQLIEYAAGIIDKHPSVVKINFCIVQPRSYRRDGPVTYWRIDRQNLGRYFDRLRVCEETSLSPQALCNPNPECTYCSARHVCKALQQASMTAVENSMVNTPEELNPESVSAELRLLEHHAGLINARITGLQEQAKAYIHAGKSVPYFRMEQSNGRDKWTLPIEHVLNLGSVFDVNLAKPLELITPKQAIKAGMPESMVNKISSASKGALKLIQETEKDIRKKFID